MTAKMIETRGLAARSPRSGVQTCAGLPRRLAGRWPAIWLGLIAIQMIPLMASRAFAAPVECEVPSGLTKLSKCIGTDAKKTVIIGGGTGTGDCNVATVNAYVDQAQMTMGRITINAGSTLKVFDRTAQLPVSLSATGIDVFGTLEVGNTACPIGTINPQTVVKFTFTGPKDPACINNACPGYTKGIQVENGATFRMLGAKGAPTKGVSWTNLGDAAGPTTYDATHNVKVPAKSATQIVVANDVTVKPNAWQVNDWIAVAGTGYSPFETEFVQILSFGGLDAAGNRTINLSLSTPLKFLLRPCFSSARAASKALLAPNVDTEPFKL